MHKTLSRAKHFTFETLRQLAAQVPPNYHYEFRARAQTRGMKYWFIVAVYEPAARGRHAKQETFLGYL